MKFYDSCCKEGQTRKSGISVPNLDICEDRNNFFISALLSASTEESRLGARGWISLLASGWYCQQSSEVILKHQY